MLIGYMRVSTGEQNLDLQRDALDRAGCGRVFDDVCSGRATERAGLDKALDIMRDGDTLVVWKLDRIGRSLPHVVGLVGDLQKRGIGLKVLTGDIDTTTVTGRYAANSSGRPRRSRRVRETTSSFAAPVASTGGCQPPSMRASSARRAA